MRRSRLINSGPAGRRLINSASLLAAGAPTPNPPSVGDEFFDVFDDFETPNGSSAMTGRAHWSGALSQWNTDNGKIHQNALYGGAAYIQFGDSNWTDFDVTFDYETGGSDVDGAWSDSRQTLQAWWKDANNYIDLALDAANHRVMVTVMVSGSAAASKEFDNIRGTAGGTGNITFLTSGKLRVQMKSNKLKIWIDGTALAPAGTYSPPWDSWNVTSLVGSGNRQGKVGAQQNAYRWPVLNAIGVRALDIQCTSIDGAVGRKAYSGAGASVGTVTYAGTYSGTPVSWISRLLDATDPDGGPILGTRAGENANGWKTVSATAGSGAYSIAEDLPLGGPYIVEHGYLDGSGLRHTAFSQPTVVGYRIISYGQSTAVGRGGFGGFSIGSLPKGAAPVSSYNVLSDYGPGYMVNGMDPYVGADTLSSFAFTNTAQQIASAPVIFEAYGVPGTGIASLMNGSSGWTDFVAALATRKGVIEGMIWDQGQGDTDTILSAANANIAAYAGNFTSNIVAPIRALTGKADLPIIIAHMGRYGSTTTAGGSNQAEFDSLREQMRKLQFALSTEGGGSDANIHTGEHHNGLLYGDQYHPTNQATGGWDRLNERAAWSAMKHFLGLSVHSGRGPTPASASRSGAVINVQLTMNGATSLSDVTFNTNTGGTGVYPTQPPNRFRGWDFSTSSTFGTLLAVSSWAIGADGHSIDFTLASAPGAPVYVRNLYGAGYDDSRMIHGVYSGSGYDHSIPLEPIMNATGFLISN
jgi:hypothetical protein